MKKITIYHSQFTIINYIYSFIVEKKVYRVRKKIVAYGCYFFYINKLNLYISSAVNDTVAGAGAAGLIAALYL